MNIVRPPLEKWREKLAARMSGTPAIAPPTPPISSPSMTRMADVKPQAIRWLWPQRIALGKLSLIAGDPGRGKSTIALDMIARVSTGSPWPDGSECPLGSALLITAEDGLADTVRPRLDRHGADCAKVLALEGVEVHATKRQRSITLADVSTIEQAILSEPDIRIVVVDPVSAFMSDKDSHNNAEVRGLLAPLSQLAEAQDVAIVLITHLSKGGGGKAMYRAMGSLAFVAACRAAYLVCDDEEVDGRRLFLPTKNNLGDDRTGLAYSIVDGRIEWEKDLVDTRADDAVTTESKAPGPNPRRRREAEDWLRGRLASGPVEANDLKAEAKERGIAPRTLRYASDEMGLCKERNAYTKRWEWRLPRSGTAQLRQLPPHSDNYANLDNIDNNTPFMGDSE